MAASNTTAHSPHVATDIPQTERFQKGAGFSSGSPKLPVSSILFQVSLWCLRLFIIPTLHHSFSLLHAVCIRACERCSACDVRLTEGEMPLEREDDLASFVITGSTNRIDTTSC